MMKPASAIRSALFLPFIIILFLMVESLILASMKEAQAQEPQTSVTRTEPLVIIRFNQKNVYFERSLSNAVSRAQAVKPAVIFDVVLATPELDDSKAQKAADRKAELNLARVVTALGDSGVPQPNIQISKEKNPRLRHDEVYIYVQ